MEAGRALLSEVRRSCDPAECQKGESEVKCKLGDESGEVAGETRETELQAGPGYHLN